MKRFDWIKQDEENQMIQLNKKQDWIKQNIFIETKLNALNFFLKQEDILHFNMNLIETIV